MLRFFIYTYFIGKKKGYEKKMPKERQIALSMENNIQWINNNDTYMKK